MTELSPLGTAAVPGDPGRAAGVSGKPAIGVDLLLTDAEGRALAEQRGAEGHLRVSGPSVVERYFGHDRPATDAEGWFDTRPLARPDRAGQPNITGRFDTFIHIRGTWAHPP